jgi:hypothetical protein
MADPGGKARQLHDQARDWPQLPASIATIHEAYVRSLRDLNRKWLLKGSRGDIQSWDPRDILVQIESICAGLRMQGKQPGMDNAAALGGYALALGLAVARVEDSQPHLGDAA